MRARLQAFVGDLRITGIEVSVAESLDAMRAVGVAGLERDVLREALAATLVKDERDRVVFDDAFERHFPLPPPPEPPRRRGRGARSAGVPAAGTGRGRGGTSAGRTRVPREQHDAHATMPAARRGSTQTPASGRRARRARADELRRRPWRDLTAGEVGELRELMALLAEELRRRLARRWRASRRGVVDLRRTLRAAIATDGVPLRLGRRRRRSVPPDLLVLCDVSGSVAAASELLLALIAPAAGFFRRVHLYAYVDRLCPVVVEDGRMVPDGPLDLHARSDLGRVLVDLRARHPRIAPSTLVVVLGDGRNNRRPPRADLLRAMHDQAQRLVWIVPEPRHRWGTGDSALPLYAPWCDALVECVDVDGLLRAVRRALA